MDVTTRSRSSAAELRMASNVSAVGHHAPSGWAIQRTNGASPDPITRPGTRAGPRRASTRFGRSAGEIWLPPVGPRLAATLAVCYVDHKLRFGRPTLPAWLSRTRSVSAICDCASMRLRYLARSARAGGGVRSVAAASGSARHFRTVDTTSTTRTPSRVGAQEPKAPEASSGRRGPRPSPSAGCGALSLALLSMSGRAGEPC
jgi:hypothetical protein